MGFVEDMCHLSFPNKYIKQNNKIRSCGNLEKSISRKIKQKAHSYSNGKNVKKSLPVVKIPRSVSRGSTDLNECDNITRQ